MTIDKQDSESMLSYAWRITIYKDEMELSYSEWSLLLIGKEYSDETARKAYYIIKPLLEALMSDDKSKNKTYNDIRSKEIQLQKERIRQTDERRNFENLVRNEARWETLFDMIKEGLDNLEYNHKLNIYPYEIRGSESEAVLILSDWHIGVEINTPSNVFNIEVAKERVDKLIKETIKHCKNNNVTKLHVALAGDLVQGIIHVNSRLRQNENIINQVLIASELVTDLIASLSQSIRRIEVYNVNGNHGRVNANIKESLDEENFESLVYEIVKLKLDIIKERERIAYNVHFNENEFNDISLIDVMNKKVAVSHGHKDRKQNTALDKLNHLLDEYRVNELITGHFHNVRLGDGVTVNGALSGSDDFAQSKRFNNNPSQILKIYFDDNTECLFDINLK